MESLQKDDFGAFSMRVVSEARGASDSVETSERVLAHISATVSGPHFSSLLSSTKTSAKNELVPARDAIANSPIKGVPLVLSVIELLNNVTQTLGRDTPSPRLRHSMAEPLA